MAFTIRATVSGPLTLPNNQFFLLQLPDGTYQTLAGASASFTNLTQNGVYYLYHYGEFNPGNTSAPGYTPPEIIPLPAGTDFPVSPRMAVFPLSSASATTYSTQFIYTNFTTVPQWKCSQYITDDSQCLVLLPGTPNVAVGSINSTTVTTLPNSVATNAGGYIYDPVNQYIWNSGAYGSLGIYSPSYGLLSGYQQFYPPIAGVSGRISSCTTDGAGYLYLQLDNTTTIVVDVRSKTSKYWLNAVQLQNRTLLDTQWAGFGNYAAQTLQYYNGYLYYADSWNLTNISLAWLRRVNVNTGVVSSMTIDVPANTMVNGCYIQPSTGLLYLTNRTTAGTNISFPNVFNINQWVDNGVLKPISTGPANSLSFYSSSPCTAAGAFNYFSSSKKADVLSAVVGDEIEYTITFTNTGVGTYTGITLLDNIPNVTSFVTNSASLDGTPIAGNPTVSPGITIPNMPIGSTHTLTFKVLVNSQPSTNPIQNNATLSFTDQAGNAQTWTIGPANTTIGASPIFEPSTGFVKSVSSNSTSYGGSLIYSFTLKNSGTVDANNVVLTDSIPAGTTFVANSAIVNGSPNTGDPTTTGITIGTIAAGATATVSFNVLVGNPTPTNILLNTGVISYNYAVGTATVSGSNISNTVSTVVGAPPTSNLSGSVKVADKSAANIGDVITYFIGIPNTGSISANNVVVKDTLPSQVSFIPGTVIINGTSNPTADPTSSTGISIGNISAGANAIISFQVKVISQPATNPISNVANITYSDTNTPNGNVTTPPANTTINATPTGANFGTSTKTVDKGTANVGDTITYTINLINSGTSAATSVTLDDTLSSYLTFNSGTVTINGISQPTANPNNGITIGPIAAGATTVVTFTATINSYPGPSPITNRGTIIYSDATGLGKIAQTTVATTAVNQPTAGDLSGSTKTADKSSASIGSTINYTLTIKNNGLSAATNVVVRDTFVTGINFLSGSVTVSGTPQPTYDITSGFTITSIPAGGIVVVAFQATVGSIPNPNPFINVASLSYNNGISTVTNNITGGVTTVTGNTPPSFSTGTKTGVTTATVGQTIPYVINLPNTGTTNANNVTIKDTLPSGLVFVSGSVYVNGVNQPSLDPTSSSGANVGTINAGATSTVTFSVKVNSIPTPNPFTNNANISYTDPSGNPYSNNLTGPTTNFIIEPTPPSFSSGTKTGPTTATVGQTITYTLSLPNTGTTNANNVTIKDILPSGLSFVPGSVYVNTVNQPSLDPTSASGANVGTVNAGSTTIVTFQVKVNSVPMPNPFTNNASISYTDPSGNPYSNTLTGPTTNFIASPTPPNFSSGSKTGVTTAQVGQIIPYIINLPNTGTTNANNVTIKDTLPNGLVFVSGSVYVNGINQPSLDPTSASGANIGTVNAGANVTVTFQVKVNSIPTPNPFTNNASISYTDPSGNPYSNAFTGPTTNFITAPTPPNFGSGIKTGPTTATIGQTITYTLSLPNTGTTNANNVTIKDILPSGLSFVPGSVYVNTVNQPGLDPTSVSGANIGSINAGATATVTFQVKVNSIPTPNPFTNNASISYTDPSGNSYSNTFKGPSTDFTGSGANINGTTKIPDKVMANIGDTITYTLKIPNSGSQNATNVVIKDIVPFGISYVLGSLTVNGSSYPGDPTSNLGVNIGTINAGSTAIVTFKLLITSLPNSSTFVNNVSISYSDNSGSHSDSFQSTPVVINGSMMILVKKSSINYIAVGNTVKYTITATNTSSILLTNVLVSDTLSSSLAFVPGSVTVNGISNTGSILTGILIPKLAPGSSEVITFEAKVISAGTISNIAAATYQYSLLPNGSIYNGMINSNSTTINSVLPNLDINKTSDTSYAVLDDIITYTITINNDGTVNAYNVIFQDELPKAVSLLNGTFTLNGNIIYNVNLSQGIRLGNIPVGKTIVITYKVKVISISCTCQLTNKVYLKYSYVFPDGSVSPINSEIEQCSSLSIPMGISNFKQFSIEKYLSIPCKDHIAEDFNSGWGTIKIDKYYPIQTNPSNSAEGQILTSQKLIIKGTLDLVVEYNICDIGKSVHSMNYCIPFSTFVILPNSYNIGDTLEVSGLVEDVYLNIINGRDFFTTIIAMVAVKIINC